MQEERKKKLVSCMIQMNIAAAKIKTSEDEMANCEKYISRFINSSVDKKTKKITEAEMTVAQVIKIMGETWPAQMAGMNETQFMYVHNTLLQLIKKYNRGENIAWNTKMKTENKKKPKQLAQKCAS